MRSRAARRVIVESRSPLQAGQAPQKGAPSLNHFDSRPVTWRPGERRVAGDDRRIQRLCQGHVHGVVRSDVLAQPPRTGQQIEMGVTVESEVGEIGNRFGRAVR